MICNSTSQSISNKSYETKGVVTIKNNKDSQLFETFKKINNYGGIFI